MGALAIFLQDRLKETDYSGALTKTVLEVSCAGEPFPLALLIYMSSFCRDARV